MWYGGAVWFGFLDSSSSIEFARACTSAPGVNRKASSERVNMRAGGRGSPAQTVVQLKFLGKRVNA